MNPFGVTSRVFALVLALTLLIAERTYAQKTPILVSGPSPFSECTTSGFPGELNYLNSKVEAQIAVDPADPDHLIGVWEQDVWSLGGSRGLMTGVSRDGGKTWSRTFAHFSRCAGGDAQNGGDYERARDPWVTFSSSGAAYQISRSFGHFPQISALLVSRSLDGGDTWSEPTTLIRDTNFNVFNDKGSITGDPTDSQLVYAVWTRFDGVEFPPFTGPIWFSRTTDGLNWESPRIIYDPGPNRTTLSNQIVVLPDGTLVNLFVRPGAPATVALIRSTDKGITWSQPIIVNDLLTIGVVNPKSPSESVSTGRFHPNITFDLQTGALYVVWQDARFSDFQTEGIVLAKSDDGGLTWSEPVQVNQVPTVQAFTASVAVWMDGRVSVTYYDFREDTPDPATLLTNYWQVTSEDGGDTWHEVSLGDSFDMRTAPKVGGGFFLGDYQGLGQAQESITPLFVATNSGDLCNRTDVFTIPTEQGADDGEITTPGGDEVYKNSVIKLSPKTRQK